VKLKSSEPIFDIVVVGAGFCGSIIALKAAELGLRVRVYDSRDPYPDEFRAEKLEPDQFESLEALQLISLVRPENSKFIDEVHSLTGNKERIIPCHKHRGLDYSATVNSFRSVLRSNDLLKIQKVLRVNDLSAGCAVVTEDGSIAQGRLCIVATGMSKQLTQSLGLKNHSQGALMSTTFGFDIEPASAEPFPFQAFNVYPGSFTPGLQYLTFFPIGNRMRCNLFTCWKPGTAESKRLRNEMLMDLHERFPGLEKRIGPFRLSTKIQVFTTNYYRQSVEHLQRVVLVGDAYQSVSPATGMGLSKCLSDAESLLPLLRLWGPSSTWDLDLSSFYRNPKKRRIDDSAFRRWSWANESSTSRSFMTILKRLKRKLDHSKIRQLLDYPRSTGN
jgi:2-polyprenyl-6-methoxyphenol hydroxylase-like FAD-dependent oxidoreductase